MHLFTLIRRLRQRLVNRYALRALLEADDRLLDDIGVTRAEVLHASRLPLWKDPAVHPADGAGQHASQEPTTTAAPPATVLDGLGQLSAQIEWKTPRIIVTGEHLVPDQT